MPRTKKRTSRPQPSRMRTVERREPTLIRHDYGYPHRNQEDAGGHSPISMFDADRRRNPRPNPIIREANRRDFKPELQYEQGGEVKGKSTIKIAGQYAVEPIRTTPEGNQYVSMELPDGEIATVFGDWETYGNPNRDGLIEDLDYRIYPLGDGTYALDAAEAEADMLREEARQFSQDAQGGQGASATEDLLEKLSDRKGMGMTPDGRMRPIKRN